MLQTFHTSLTDAMNCKGQHPERALLVSVEENTDEHDDFWRDSAVLSIVSRGSMVMRLAQSRSESDYRQFTAVFSVAAVPSLYYFAPNSAAVSHVWAPFPSKEEFAAFFAAAAPPPQSSREESAEVRITVQGQRFSRTRAFAADSTVGELREWVRRQFGECGGLTVQSTMLPLPADDAQSLSAAGLAPAAALVLPAESSAAAATESEQTVGPYPPDEAPARERELRCCCRCRFIAYAKLLLSIFNPWDAQEDDELHVWELAPNPRLADVIAERMQNGGANFE